MTAPALDRLVPDYIKTFEAYIPSKPDPELMRLFGVDRLHRLNNNENPLGPPPAAQEVIRRLPPERSAVYPSGDAYYLRRRIAEAFDLDPDQIIVGNGANEVITFAIKAFCEAGDNIVTADKTFAVYEWVATFSGFDARLVPLRDYAFDDAGILERIDGRTKLVFICNPNNPTGTYWSTSRLRAFLEAIGGRCIVVVDEAYAEYVEKPDFPDGIALIREYPNLVVFRTFSKMFGLAGLRIGYLVGSPAVVDVMRRTCVVYSVNLLAQEAALAAFGDTDHVGRTRTLMREQRSRIEPAMARLGLPIVSHEGNFLMIRLPFSDTLAYRKLMAQGVMVRSMTGFRYPNHIRLTLSHPAAMDAFIAAMDRLMGEHRAEA